MLLHGVSAVRYEDVELLPQLLNSGLTPVVAQYGGLGASGDLSHSARVFSCLRRLPGVKVATPDGMRRRITRTRRRTKGQVTPKGGRFCANQR